MQEVIKTHIAQQIEAADRQLAKFKAALDSNPAHAFEWADGSFRVAAIARVWLQIEHQLDQGSSIEQVAMDLQDDVARQARRVEASTSPTSNIMARYDLVAKAEAAEWLDNVRRRLALSNG